jgi:hypothetical protein
MTIQCPYYTPDVAQGYVGITVGIGNSGGGWRIYLNNPAASGYADKISSLLTNQLEVAGFLTGERYSSSLREFHISELAKNKPPKHTRLHRSS